MAYTLHGMLLAIDGNYRAGYAFAMLGKQINDSRFPNPGYTPRVRNITANSINPFFNHLETNLELYLESYRLGPQVGDIFFSLWAAFFMVLLRTMKGDPLADVLVESDKYLQFVRDTRDRNIIHAYEILRQIVRCLQGQTDALGSLDGDGFAEADHVARHEQSHFHSGLLWYGAFKAGVHVHLGQHERALAAAAISERAIAYDIGFWSTTNHYFYQAIAMFRLYAGASAGQRRAFDRVLARNLGKFAQWAAVCPVNFAHRYELLRGERARIEGELIDAVTHYDRAIAGAAAGRFTSDEALALEIAGQFYVSRGRDRVARVYLTDAYYAYARWGATAKTRQMAAEYSDYLLVARDEANHALDLLTVLKASQTISSEIVQDRLLATVMTLLTENAGAERGVLVLDRGGQPMVELAATAGGTQVIDQPLADYPELARGVVNLVYRTQRSLVLDDAQRDARFIQDAYIARIKPRSVLCVPIMNRGRLRGVAWFENNLSCNVFTVDRLAVLELLVSQAAISIENATLYRELESRVTERTDELRHSLDELKLAQVELEQANTALRKEIDERQQIEVELRLAQKLESVGRLAAGVAHEINTPIQFVQNHVAFVRDAADDLLQVVSAYRQLREAATGGPAEQVSRALVEIERLEDETELDYLAGRIPDALGQALYGLDRVATLVRSMKDFAHADQREKAPSDINRALAATLTITHNEYTYVADVRAELGDLPPVVCHLSELNQCFLNLIVNAAHAIADKVGNGERGTIGVTTRVDGDSVVVAISDTGGGIPAEIQDKIFDPFFTTKELGRGTGQGLAIARSVIVDKHGGSLTFETELGAGTTFYIRLPIAAAAAAAA
jgi:signal transduction histidine kinase